LLAVTLGVSALSGVGDPGRRRRALLAAFLGGLAFLPFALAYRRAEVLYGMKRYVSEILFFSGRWGDFLSAGERDRLWGPVTAAWRHPEGDFFPGIAAVLLAAVAVAVVRRPAVPGLPPTPSPLRRRAARVLDAVIALLALVWIAALVGPGLRIGA